ncbi:hypothetical protein GC722_01400 [Auraticoccus sp. F435]|uniref:Glycoside hydrolase family 65 n=1 Tax=Auraticoccus cholistanensis TaxID=2656650 RepID=A0A6A9USJ5_9ACTN|nr:hypothetical protein [Auraticoccus cholistanensis]MVA74695.1 hypothetical protein [Auraticoccus cholistanensis]
MTIDRHALVRRHRVRHERPDPLSPLSVGNGELCFTADITGLQTFPELHDRATARAEGRSAMPLGTQSQWGYHWTPNPERWTLADTMETYDSPRGPVQYPTRYDYHKDKAASVGDEAPGYYFWVNPQRLHLVQVGLALTTSDGRRVGLDELTQTEQELDPWTGILTSSFRCGGSPVRVTTTVHPERDVLAVRVESELLVDGRARLQLAFPHVHDTFEADADWDRPDDHSTTLRDGEHGTVFDRRLDRTRYVAVAGGLPRDRFVQTAPHTYLLDSAGADVLELALELAPAEDGRPLPDVAATEAASRRGWEAFWLSGAAVDLSGSTDPRAAELERRIVLSQYQTAVNCAGSTPSQESGLVCNSWSGTFHLEMHWWHAAHFAAWGRPELLERSFDWYDSVLDVARETARAQGFRGARWPKHVGPEGIEHPNRIGPLLVWQQPHPIHFAELIYQARGEDPAVLARYDEIVAETAEFIASFALREDDGRYHLPPPLIPAQEVYGSSDSWDPLFETAYFRWALETAQRWRERQGLGRRADWDEVAAGLVLDVSEDGCYDAVQRPPRTEYTDHPSMLAALGVVPDTGLVDAQVMRATLDRVLERWRWPSAWGWDFPVMAMCATRLGEPGLALELLLRPEVKNTYLANGHNFQVDNRLPLYLPGNGGLLMAVALLAGGWVRPDGSRVVPPAAEGWVVRAEGFPARP